MIMFTVKRNKNQRRNKMSQIRRDPEVLNMTYRGGGEAPGSCKAWRIGWRRWGWCWLWGNQTAAPGHSAWRCCWQTPEDKKETSNIPANESENKLGWRRLVSNDPQKVKKKKKKISSTCQHMCGDFLSKTYWVSGDGSSSYLSKGSLSITMGSQSTQEKRTAGCADRGGCEREREWSEEVWKRVMSSQKERVKITERGTFGCTGCKLKVADSCLTASDREEDEQSQGGSERETLVRIRLQGDGRCSADTVNCWR